MSMHDYAVKEFKKLEKQMAQDNRKLEALRVIIKEYATEDYPSVERMNMIITECLRKHDGHADFDQIAECIDDHNIIIPRTKLSLILTKNENIYFDRNTAQWKINLPLHMIGN